MRYSYLKISLAYLIVQYFLFVLFPYSLRYDSDLNLTFQERFVDALWYLIFLKFSYFLLFYTVIVFLIPIYLYVIQYNFFKKIYVNYHDKAVYFLIGSLLATDVIRWLIMNTIRHY